MLSVIYVKVHSIGFIFQKQLYVCCNRVVIRPGHGYGRKMQRRRPYQTTSIGKHYTFTLLSVTQTVYHLIASSREMYIIGSSTEVLIQFSQKPRQPVIHFYVISWVSEFSRTDQPRPGFVRCCEITYARACLDKCHRTTSARTQYKYIHCLPVVGCGTGFEPATT